jgi:hypothetical protein
MSSESRRNPRFVCAWAAVIVGARGTLRLTAQVRHQSPAGMGVQFTRFEPGQVDVLQQLIASLPR